MATNNLRVNDPAYQQRRDEVLDRDDCTCVHCGYTRGEGTKRIEVHHVVPARLFENQEMRDAKKNLVTLCSMCHAAWDLEFQRLLQDEPARDEEDRTAVRKRLDRLEGDLEALDAHGDLGNELRDIVCDDGGDDAAD